MEAGQTTIDPRRPLEDILDRAAGRADAEGALSLDALLDVFGPRSLGPLLMVFGLIASVPPIGAIPLMPTTMGVLTFLFAIQFVLGRKRVWLPGLLGRRSVSAGKMAAMRARAAKAAKRVDRLLRPRLTVLTSPLLNRLVALAACGLAVIMPPLEVVPFGVAVPGLALVCLGLGLVARDGLFTLIGFLIGAVAVVLVVVVVPRAAEEAAEATEEVRAEAAEAAGQMADGAKAAATEALDEAGRQVDAVAKEAQRHAGEVARRAKESLDPATVPAQQAVRIVDGIPIPRLKPVPEGDRP